MSIEFKLREEISKYKRGSDEESILKVLLGDCQQKAANNKLNDESFQEIVRKMVKDNKETMLLLQDDRKENLSYLDGIRLGETQAFFLVGARKCPISSLPRRSPVPTPR